MQHKQHTRTRISGGKHANLAKDTHKDIHVSTRASAMIVFRMGILMEKWFRGLFGQSFHCGNQQRHNAFSHLAVPGPA